MDKATVFEVIKEKMCEIAGLDFSLVHWADGSHLRLTWSEQQEQEFRNWMAETYIKDKQFRESLTPFPRFRSKKFARKIADNFVCQYGFRTLD